VTSRSTERQESNGRRKALRLARAGEALEAEKAHGRMWGETNPRAAGGIKPLRGGGTLRADGAGEVNRHNDRQWWFRRRAAELHGRRLVRSYGCGQPSLVSSSDAPGGVLPRQLVRCDRACHLRGWVGRRRATADERALRRPGGGVAVTSVAAVITRTLVLRDERLRARRAFGLAGSVTGAEPPSGGTALVDAAIGQSFGIGRLRGRRRA